MLRRPDAAALAAMRAAVATASLVAREAIASRATAGASGALWYDCGAPGRPGRPPRPVLAHVPARAEPDPGRRDGSRVVGHGARR